MTRQRPEYYFYSVFQSLHLHHQNESGDQNYEITIPIAKFLDCHWSQFTLYYRNEFSWIVKAELLELKCHSLHRDFTNPQK